MAVLGGSLAIAQTNAAGDPDTGSSLTPSGNIVITRPGTVITNRDVRGYILVQADNVTIRNTRVTYGGSHPVRIFDGADGTVIEDSEVTCTTSLGTGVVFGNYVARRVTVNGCKYGFKYSDTAPAIIEDSYWNGKPINVHESTASRDAVRSPVPTTSPSPSSTATSSPRSIATATPTTSPTSTSAPTASGFPNATNTGVPTGTSLTATGSLTVTRDGTVIDAKLVRGTIKVQADNVTIRRTKIENDGNYPIQLDPTNRGLLIEDTEIDGNGIAGIAVLQSHYTLRRVNIHDVIDGPRIVGDNVLIEDTYIHHLSRRRDSHNDSIQIRGGTNIVIRHNNLQAYRAETDDPMNAAIQTGSLVMPLKGVLIERNLMNGGNYTINAGGPSVENWVARYNRFGRDCRYGVVQGLDSHDTWIGNVWHDTGETIPR
ncbi:MAG: hypothetical protein ACRDQW_10885 [Haloechinothrix sp.]